MLARIVAWQLAWRLAVEALLWSFPRGEAGGGRPRVFAALLLLTGPPAFFVVLSFVWWLLTGRGPGLRLVSYDLGAPTQRTRAAGAARA